MRVTLKQACALVKQGKIVAIPTETVYGLAASLSHSEAIEEIYERKGRPKNKPLTIHLAYRTQVENYAAVIPKDFDRLAGAFWPGPLTLILPAKKECVAPIVRGGLDTIAFRIPDHPLARQVLVDCGPLAVPSANRSGKFSATTAEHVEEDFGKNFPVLDGGACAKGVESTILTYCRKRWHILRLGVLSPEAFAPVLGYIPKAMPPPDKDAEIIDSKQEEKDRVPLTTLILDEEVLPQSIGVVVGFSDRTYPPSCRVFSLGVSTDPAGVAKHLYEVLHRLDLERVGKAWIDTDFPQGGLWMTVLERLRTWA
ncbi:MAG: L-threonylcarbamoyladenylate synthase [Waddliaceae bacterium]